MKKTETNTRVFATEGNDGWFNIYVSDSGSLEYVMSHRRNDRIYELLKNGVRLGELEHMKKGLKNRQDETMERFSKGNYNSRYKSMKNRQRKNVNSLDHIILVIKEYMCDRATADAEWQVA